MLYIYIYISEKNTFWKKKLVKMVKMVEVPSYHTNSLTTFTDSTEFLLLCIQRRTWRNRMAIYWHTSPKAYTSIYSEYRSCLFQKMLDWFNSPCIHPSLSTRCMNLGMFGIGLSMAQLLEVTLGVTLNIFKFCLRVHIFTGMRWLTLQWYRVTLVTLFLHLHCDRPLVWVSENTV